MKVYEIYSGQPKRFGMTLFQQMAFLAGIIPPLWLENYWLLLVVPWVFLLISKVLTKEDENMFVQFRNMRLPAFIRGRFIRHTLAHKIKP
jgi:hypothetical protein